MSQFNEIKNCLKNLESIAGVSIYLPKVTTFQKEEIKFHDQIHKDEIEIHQLNSLRNSYYHNYFKKWLFKLPANSTILEIGAGYGFDLLPLVKRGYNVIESDISLESIKSVKEKINFEYPQAKEKILFLVASGDNLPFEDNSLAAVFMVATFHHFESQEKVLAEINRVTNDNGQIIFAMEPSRFMMWFTKLFTKSKKLRIYDGHSIADESHAGYSRNDFIKLFNKSEQLSVKLKRVWLTLGFLHYSLEAIYRIFKLKKRIKVPRFIEWPLLVLDEILLKIPIFNQLNWHWIVIAKKIKFN